MPRKEYRRIGGRGARRRQFFTWNTLWLGDDHLLQVENTGYTEEYKRFYFRDIQSIIIRKDNRFLYWSLFFGVCMAGCVALFSWVDDVAGQVFFGSMGSLFLLLLLINLIKGPSCYTRIRTAVQEEEVPAFRRVLKTRKAMEEVRALILEAQGGMSPEEMRARLGRGQESASGPLPGGTAREIPPAAEPASPETKGAAEDSQRAAPPPLPRTPTYEE
jgi:hypothetical protein